MTPAKRDWLLRSRPFLVYPVVIVAIAAIVAARQSAGLLAGSLLVSGGLLAWTLVEWVLHWAMHIRLGPPGFRRFQDEAHISHHRQPQDLEHSVIRLRGSIPLAFVFFGLWMVFFRNVDRALLFQMGLLIGYVFYEWVHLASHGAWQLSFIRWLMRYHAMHHYQSWNRTFGVTSPLWDWVFGTLPQPRASKTRTQPASNAAS